MRGSVKSQPIMDRSDPDATEWPLRSMLEIVDETLIAETKLETELARLREENREMVVALQPFAVYAEKRAAKPIKNLGDSVHAIHTGTEWEAEITLSDCEAARAILARTTHASEGKGAT